VKYTGGVGEEAKLFPFPNEHVVFCFVDKPVAGVDLEKLRPDRLPHLSVQLIVNTPLRVIILLMRPSTYLVCAVFKCAFPLNSYSLLPESLRRALPFR
jgi:hypothetical protein